MMHGCARALSSAHKALAVASVRPMWRALYRVPIESATGDTSRRVSPNILGNDWTTLLSTRLAASCREKAPSWMPHVLSWIGAAEASGTATYWVRASPAISAACAKFFSEFVREASVAAVPLIGLSGGGAMRASSLSFLSNPL